MNTLIKIRVAVAIFAIATTIGQTPAQQFAASGTDDAALGIGAEVPDFTLQKVLDRGITSRRTLHGSGRDLVIIDFWSIYCKGCIASFPKLDSLQQRFGNQVQFLLSTYETEAQIRGFMERNPIGKRIALASVVEDTVLGHYFPHQSIPHVVWIYKGRVVGITGTEYLTVSNIQTVLSGAAISWPVKNEAIAHDYDQPLLRLTGNPEFAQHQLTYTALMGYQDGLGGKHGIVVDSAQGTRRVYFINQPVLNAYFMLHIKTMDVFGLKRPHIFITPNQLVVEGVDLHRIWYDREVSGYRAAWEREHSITMELVLPDRAQGDTVLYRLMKSELDRMLGLHAGFERRKVDCLVLRPLNARATHASPASDASGALRTLLGNPSPVSSLVHQMNLQKTNPPVFDESGYTEALEVTVTDWTDVRLLNKHLKPYGLTLVSEMREVDLFVIRRTP